MKPITWNTRLWKESVEQFHEFLRPLVTGLGRSERRIAAAGKGRVKRTGCCTPFLRHRPVQQNASAVMNTCPWRAGANDGKSVANLGAPLGAIRWFDSRRQAPGAGGGAHAAPCEASHRQGSQRPMKIVLDTNVFVFGIFFSGPPHRILRAWRDGRLDLAYSAAIFCEYERVIDELSREFRGVEGHPF